MLINNISTVKLYALTHVILSLVHINYTMLTHDKLYTLINLC